MAGVPASTDGSQAGCTRFRFVLRTTRRASVTDHELETH